MDKGIGKSYPKKQSSSEGVVKKNKYKPILNITLALCSLVSLERETLDLFHIGMDHEPRDQTGLQEADTP